MKTYFLFLMSQYALDIIQTVAMSIGALGIIFGFLSYWQSKNGNYINLIQKCTKEFREIMKDLYSIDLINFDKKNIDENSNNRIKDLLGLLNEEVFLYSI